MELRPPVHSPYTISACAISAREAVGQARCLKPKLKRLARTLVVTSVVGSSLVTAPVASSFQLGFEDSRAVWPVGRSATEWWLTAGEAIGASLFRYELQWRSVAPTKPQDGSNQADTAYRWSSADAAIRYARSIDAEAELSISCAPAWAQGPNTPEVANGSKGCFDPAAPQTGSWNPNADEFGRFATALATRYDGKHEDPLDRNQMLPRVRLFEAWNEPNYKMFLSPQCSKGSMLAGSSCSSRGKLVSPDAYRELLNSFYDGVKRVQPDALVAIGGLGSGAASSQGREIPPQPFLRSILCLAGQRPPFTAVKSCPVKAKFDALGFHPYTFMGTPTTNGGPWTTTQLGNTPELRATLNSASELGTVEPAGPKQLWATEFAWATNPPGRFGRSGLAAGIPPARAASYTAETIYRLWSWGVEKASWWSAVDRNGGLNATGTSWPTGFYFEPASLLDAPSVSAKPGLQAFRFPVFARKTPDGGVAWALSPCKSLDAVVTFSAGRGKRWTVIATSPTDSDGVAQTDPWPISDGLTKVKADASGTGCTAESSLVYTIAAR